MTIAHGLRRCRKDLCEAIPGPGFTLTKAAHIPFPSAVLSMVTILTNAGLGPGGSAMQWSAQDVAIVPMTLATVFVAIFIRTRSVPASAVAIRTLGRLWYFARFQSALAE